MENVMGKLLKIGIEHPARVMDFAELTKGLFTEVSEGNVRVNYHPEFPHLALFKYSQDCVTGRRWNKFSLMARGLILDLKDKKIIATPFVKFFNFGEIEPGSKSIIQSEFTVTEKVDGSLGIMFFYAGQFRFATAGSFISDQAKWAEKWMYKEIPVDKIDKTNTYLFEIIYPENKIVVNYYFEGLVLLSVFDSYGLEYEYEQIKWEASYMGTHYAQRYDFEDMDSILNNAKTLDRNSEGYVIRFKKNGIRLKVKGDEYVRIHRLVSRVTPIAIWESILNGDNLNEIKKELPEEMENDFNTIVEIIYGKLDTFLKEVESLHIKTKLMSDKELGIYMQGDPIDLKDRIFKETLRYVFPMRNNKFYESFNDIKSIVRRKIFNAFKPKANVLDGYTPSSVVNRFTDLNN